MNLTDQTDQNLSREIEIAHVLFMDIVGYSRLPMSEQTRQLEQLRDLVSDTTELRRAATNSDLIRLPTGDGMALVFFRNPIAPIQCAIEISRALRNRPHLKLRMGVHSGPVHRVEDINASINVSGSAVNLAQRVMDCGDAGHILGSSVVADMLSQVGAWASYMHDIGEGEVKHGQRVHLFNLYGDDFGNPAVPEILRSRRMGTPASAIRLLKIALLYKHHATTDEQVLALLEAHFRTLNYDVFIDRHLTIGVEWALEIERQIRTSDVVVPLLSAASIHSEMLTYEVQIAKEASQKQNGKPRLLPVRVNYTGPLTTELSGILDPIHYYLWESPNDDQPLIEDITKALASRPTDVAAHSLEPVGGAVPLDSEFYVVRTTDEEFRAAIARRDSIVLVKGARQMGKTSLLARGLQQARENGARVVLTDFQKLNAEHLESAESLLLTLAEWIADQLDLEVLPDEVWNPRRGPSVNLERYLRREVLAKTPNPIVWGLDEVDRLFSCNFASEVFGLIRSWHNERALDPAGPWSRLTLAIAYATEAHLFISDVNQSPFNVGTRLTLDDFTLEHVAELNRRYGFPLNNQDEITRYFQLVGGNPYLVRRGLHEMVTHHSDIDAFEAQADRDEGIFGDHLRRILVLLARDSQLTEVVRSILQGKPSTTAESFYRLRSAGVMSGDTTQDVHPRCQLYASYLKRHLL